MNPQLIHRRQTWIFVWLSIALTYLLTVRVRPQQFHLCHPHADGQQVPSFRQVSCPGQPPQHAVLPRGAGRHLRVHHLQLPHEQLLGGQQQTV